jgi:hypothetical protein
MADHIYIKCLGETFGARSPYKVYDTDDWMSIMYDRSDKGRPTEHDLNIWWDENKEKWQWAIYRLRKDREGMMETDGHLAIASGDAEVAEDYEGH